MQRGRMALPALLVLLALHALSTQAFPDLWIIRKAANDCLAHPDGSTALAFHKQTVTKVANITFVVQLDGKAVTQVCPGKDYSFQVDVGPAADAFLTVSQGELGTIDPAALDVNSACKNRNFYKGGAGGTITNSFKLPCSASGAVEIKATISTAFDDGHRWNSATLQVDPSCSDATCPSAGPPTGGTPPPLAARRPPPPATTSASPPPPQAVSSPPPSLSPPPAGTDPALTAKASMRLDMEFSRVSSAAALDRFKSQFESSVSKYLDDAVVRVEQVLAGSVVVQFTAQAASAAEVPELMEELRELQEREATRALDSAFQRDWGVAGAAMESIEGPSGSGAPPGKQACTPSTPELGYECSGSASMGNAVVTFHWSLGTALPSNPCTAGAVAADSTGRTGSEPEPGVVHMAVEGNTGGWVSVAFPRTPGAMTPADSIIGYASGADSLVNTWHLTNKNPLGGVPPTSPSWASSMGVYEKALPGGGVSTIICFSRKLSEPNSGIKPVIDPAVDVAFNWALASSDSLSSFHDRGQGVYTINLASGAAAEINDNSAKMRIVVHGVLMAIAWVGLFPLGSLIARHKWLLGDHKIGKIHTWFHLHRTIQCIALVLFVVAFAWAWHYFPDIPTGGEAGRAHQVIGTIVCGLVGFEVILGALRPGLDSPRRPLFNFVHHNLGKLAIVLSWVTVYLGIHIFNKSIHAAPLPPWIAPVAVVMGIYILADVVLTVMRSKHTKYEAPKGGPVGPQISMNTFQLAAGPHAAV